MKILYITLFLIQILSVIHSAVIGIDFGSSYYKISLIAPKKNFVIVESMRNQRKIESAIAFSDQQRHFENDALNKKSKFPENTFTFPQRFLEALDNNKTSIETKYDEYEQYIQSFNEEYKTVQFELKNFELQTQKEKQKNNKSDSEKIIVKIEEILGMIFKNAKFLSEKMAEMKDIKDCIITVPSYWSFTSRNILQTSAHIGGLNVVKILNENSAAAVYYGKDRNDLEPHNVLFYNIGANSIQASLVEYQVLKDKKSKQKDSQIVKVLADSGISNAGGNQYDIQIAEFFADIIDQQEQYEGEQSIKNNKQVMQKLITQSKRVKEVLSANKEANMNVIGLYNNQDFESHITREQFLDITQFLLNQILVPIKDVLKKSGKNVGDIHQCEILGGGVRIPKIQEILKEFLGDDKVGTHMNGDESMAQGASLYAAQLNHGLKGKSILLFDGFNYSFDISIKPLNNKNKDESDILNIKDQLFYYKQRYGSIQDYNLQTLHDVQINITSRDYNDRVEQYLVYNITNVNNMTNHKNYNATHQKYPSIKLQFLLDNLQGPYLQVEQANFTYLETVKNPKRKSQMKKQNMSPANNSTQQEKNYTITYRKRVHKYKLNIKSSHYHVQPYTKVQVIKTRRLISKFEHLEKRVKNMGSNKHRLEHLIYESRDKLQDQIFIDFSSQEEREKISQMVEKFQEWIQRQDIDHPQQQLKGRLAQLETLTNPIKKRIQESNQRKQVVREGRKNITQIKEGLDDLQRTHSWVEEDKKSQLNQRIQSVQQWIRTKVMEQKDLLNHQEPVFTSQDIKFKVDQLKEQLQNLKNIKKPKAEKNDTSSSSNKKKSKNNKKSDL